MRISLLVTACLLSVASLGRPPAKPSDAVGLPDPVIESFTAVPDCIFPDARRNILSYCVSGNVNYVTISALHHDGRVRRFHTQSSRSPASFLAATAVIDPGAASDVEGYRLIATSGAGREVGREVRRNLPFRFRVAQFELRRLPSHLRVTSGPLAAVHYTKYDALVNAVNVDSVTCSFRFDAPVDGESGRAGEASIVTTGGATVAICEIRWRNVRKARAGGTVEWVARVTDRCTDRIVQSAHVSPIR